MRKSDVYFFSVITIYVLIGICDAIDLTVDQLSCILIVAIGLPLIIPPFARWLFNESK